MSLTDLPGSAFRVLTDCAVVRRDQSLAILTILAVHQAEAPLDLARSSGTSKYLFHSGHKQEEAQFDLLLTMESLP